MNEQRRNIQSMFSGFEPEVDDQAVDAGWEKMKYFLPVEKKRRPFPLFRKRGAVLFFAAAFIFSLGLVTLEYFEADEKTPGNLAEVKIAGGKKEVKFAPPAKEIVKPEKKSHIKNPRPGTNKPGTNKPGTNKTTAPPGHNDPGKAVIIPGNNYSSLVMTKPGTQVLAGSLTNKAPEINEQPGNTKEIPKLLPAQNDPENYLELNSSALQYLPLQVAVDSLEASLVAIPPAFFLGGKKVRKFSMELFGGPGQTITKTHIAAADLNKTTRQSNFSAGCGVVYKINEEWNILTDFGVSQNKFEYFYGGMTGNKIISRTITKPTVASLSPDTLVTYTQVYSENRLRSSLNYNFSLGAEYLLYKKQRFSIGASVQLSLGRSVYTFSKTNYESGDTLSYTASPSARRLDNIVQTAESSSETKYTVTTLGLVPGLILNYRITSKVALILRPAYFDQLTTNKIKPAQNYFGLSQDKIFVDLGIRIKL